jgi:hypothetical protein
MSAITLISDITKRDLVKVCYKPDEAYFSGKDIPHRIPDNGSSTLAVPGLPQTLKSKPTNEYGNIEQTRSFYYAAATTAELEMVDIETSQETRILDLPGVSNSI